MDLDSYRRSAEAFISELTAEYYRHYAGLKDEYEIEPIYARHAELFAPDAVEELRALTDAAAPGSDGRRRLTMLLDFAVEGLSGQQTKELEAELARREAALTISIDGERIGLRESAVVQANEPDVARRAAIERERLAVTEDQLNPLYRELVERQHAVARSLGFGSYREMCATLKQVDLDRLHSQTEGFRELTESAYPIVLEPELQRTLGFGLAELRRSDLQRFFRAPEQDAEFPAERLLDSFVGTAGGLQVGLGDGSGVVLDVERRPNKSPRAFCAPVRVPGEVYLVISPVGGRDDYAALFHEGGHTSHFAGVDPELPFEYRYLGDNAITEAYAFLFQHLVEDPVWLASRLDVLDSEALVSHARAQRLVYLRRYCGKLAYELELHGRDGASADRYSALLGAALRIEWPRQTYLADVDPGFYCACYLRAWALESHIRRYLVERFGPSWFEVPDAGLLLRDLWRRGQAMAPDELLSELTGEPLDFASLADEF